MDHMMPVMDGIEAAEIIRRDCGENGAAPAIIALTANAMYYALQEYYAPAHDGYYPSEISEKNLPVIDPQLFTDPFGTNLGIDGSSYSYEPANCDANNNCKEFILRAQLEKEDVYIKKGKKQ